MTPTETACALIAANRADRDQILDRGIPEPEEVLRRVLQFVDITIEEAPAAQQLRQTFRWQSEIARSAREIDAELAGDVDAELAELIGDGDG
ncbi:hypothetical protein ACIGCK_05500 [Microbacterium sp. NPDC078428]|uniref:hypothetical protein n=1 Tax=Microbacterium sp. NPDC078428 TaxID=3364190 RepID=UPI0037CA091B